jgi:hypothetical protein
MNETTLGALRDVIERFARDRGHRRGRAEHDQHLFLRSAKPNLLERAFGQHVAALERLAEAAAERQRQRDDQRVGRCAPPPAFLRTAPHFRQSSLCPTAACRTPEMLNWQFAGAERGMPAGFA